MSTKDYLEKDYYKVLGVPKTAAADEIKQSYRKLARKYHPGREQGRPQGRGTLQGDFRGLQHPVGREAAQGVRRGPLALRGGGFRVPGTGGRPGTAGTGAGGFGGFDLGDLFGGAEAEARAGRSATCSAGCSVTGAGARTGTQTRPRRGADVETETTLSFSDAVDGTTVPLHLTGEGPCPVCHGTGAKAGTVPKVCPTCEGTGQSSRNLGNFAFSEPCKTCRGRGLVVEDPCPSCNGSGHATSTRTIQARIPAGVDDGQRIKLRGKGAPGERGGPAGDLYVRVHVTPHPVFGRSGGNLTVTVPVTVPEAALGSEIKVPSHRGAPVTVRIPAGTPNGRTFRVRGKGVRQVGRDLRRPARHRRGDGAEEREHEGP